MVFHNSDFYSTTLTAISHRRTFLFPSGLDPYIRKFVSPLGHSHHKYFIDPQHIGSTIHLWIAFHSMTCLGYSLPTSPSF